VQKPAGKQIWQMRDGGRGSRGVGGADLSSFHPLHNKGKQISHQHRAAAHFPLKTSNVVFHDLFMNVKRRKFILKILEDDVKKR